MYNKCSSRRTQGASFTLAILVAALLIGCAPQRDSILNGSNSSSAEDAQALPAAQRGKKLFTSFCAPCHRKGGQGTQGRVPPLDDSPWVAGPEERLVRIVLHGLRGPIEIHGEIYNLEMPAFKQIFQDEDIAAILTYVRQRYGEPSPPVSARTVSRIRSKTKDRETYWTVKELLRIP